MGHPEKKIRITQDYQCVLQKQKIVQSNITHVLPIFIAVSSKMHNFEFLIFGSPTLVLNLQLLKALQQNSAAAIHFWKSKAKQIKSNQDISAFCQARLKKTLVLCPKSKEEKSIAFTMIHVSESLTTFSDFSCLSLSPFNNLFQDR